MVDDRRMRARKKIPKARELGMRLTPKRLGWDIGKALQLRIAKRLSYDQIASLLHISKGALRAGLRPLLALMENPELTTGFRAHEAEFMDGVRLLAMQSMAEQLSDPKRRKKMDMSRLTMLYGVLFDKQRLIRGESTAIIHQLTAIITAASKPEGKPPAQDNEEDAIEVEGEGEDTQAHA